jgi:hypothetical protein
LYCRYRAISHLRELAASGPRERPLRVIEYSCSASSTGTQRPDLETVIRSLAGKLFLTLDFDMSVPAQIEHQKKDTPSHQTDWEQLLRDLTDEESQTCDILFLVDALDECAETQDEAFLDFMKDVINPTLDLVFNFFSRLVNMYT